MIILRYEDAVAIKSIVNFYKNTANRLSSLGYIVPLLHAVNIGLEEGLSFNEIILRYINDDR